MNSGPDSGAPLPRDSFSHLAAIPQPTRPEPASTAGPIAGFLFLGVVALYAYATFVRGDDAAAGLYVVPVLLVVSLPGIRWAAKANPGKDITGLLIVSLLLHFAAAYVRMLGAKDATFYHENGVRVAEAYRELDFGVDVGRRFIGTGFIRHATGMVHVFGGSDQLTAFLVFSWFGFWGILLIYKAATVALPQADLSRYATILFLWPSLVFWPSSIGKEAWMLWALGVTAFGAARLLTRQTGGLVITGVGAALMTLVRPHVALMFFAALAVAYLFRRDTSGSTTAGITKFLGIVLLLIGGAIGSTQAADFLEIDDFSASSISEALETTGEQTGQGSGEFGGTEVTNPILYPAALTTVLFRPFPFEAHNVEQLVSATEGMVLLGLIVLSVTRIRSAASTMLTDVYLVMCGAYTLVFCFAFAAISNFGILARQRTMLLPFVFVALIVVPLPKPNPFRIRSAGMMGESTESAGETSTNLP